MNNAIGTTLNNEDQLYICVKDFYDKITKPYSISIRPNENYFSQN